MRSPRPSRPLACLTTAAACVLLGAALPLHADDRVVYYAEPTESPNFFHRVGDFFRDLFATEQSPGPRPVPPHPTAPRYNLDLPPPGTGYGYRNSDGDHAAVDATEKDYTVSHHVSPAGSEARKRVKHVDSSNTVGSAQPSTHKSPPPVTPEPPKKKHVDTVASTESKPSTTTTVTESRTTTVTPKPESRNVPTGSRTSKASRVKSPYPPYNELDVTGLSPGSLAMDPTTQKVFRVP